MSCFFLLPLKAITIFKCCQKQHHLKVRKLTKMWAINSCQVKMMVYGTVLLEACHIHRKKRNKTKQGRFELSLFLFLEVMVLKEPNPPSSYQLQKWNCSFAGCLLIPNFFLRKVRFGRLHLYFYLSLLNLDQTALSLSCCSEQESSPIE